MFFSNKIHSFSFIAVLLLPSAHGETDQFDTNVCGSIATKQADYRGNRAYTRSGYQCQRWTEQSPHKHSRTVLNYPNHGLGDHNYCRNPDNGPEAWCFTMDENVRWESCIIPDCESNWDYSKMNEARMKQREEDEKAKQEIDHYFDDVKNLDALCEMFGMDFQTNPCEKDLLPGKRRDNKWGFERGEESVVEAVDPTVPKQDTGLMWGHVRGVAVEKNEREMPVSSDIDTKDNWCTAETDSLPSTADSLFKKTIRVLIADPDYDEGDYKKSFDAINHFNFCTQNMLAFKLIPYVISEDLSGLNWKEATFAVLQAARKKGIVLTKDSDVSNDDKIDMSFNMAELLTMVVLPDSIDMDGAYGFAILHNGLSIIKAEQAKQSNAVLHEVGHSLGMRHSSSPKGGTYGDDACIMGGPKNNMVCFNGAKSAYLGLYREYTTYVKPLEYQCDATLTIVDVHAHLYKSQNLFEICGTYYVIVVVPDHGSKKSLYLMYYKDEKILLATEGMVEIVRTGTDLSQMQIASDSQRVFDLRVEQTEKYNGVLYKLCETTDEDIARVLISHDVTAKLHCPLKDPRVSFNPPTPVPTPAPTPAPTDVPTLSLAPTSTPTSAPSSTTSPTLSLAPTSAPSSTTIPTSAPSLNATSVPSSTTSPTETSAPTFGPLLTDSNIYAVRDWWFADKQAAEDKYGPISKWDVSRVTNFYDLFYNQVSFNEDISGWDVSSVTSMSYMFYEANAFNQDLSSWNVSSVISMYGMFDRAEAFNQDLSSWNVSSVTSMMYMLFEATAFNQELCWDISHVTWTRGMFDGSKGSIGC